MADAKDGLELLEGGVGMFGNVGVELLRVQFAPVTPALFRGQRPHFQGGQIAVNRAPTDFKAAGGLGFGTAGLDEFDHSFPEIQGIGFHAQQPIRLCANVNMNCYSALSDAGKYS